MNKEILSALAYSLEKTRNFPNTKTMKKRHWNFLIKKGTLKFITLKMKWPASFDKHSCLADILPVLLSLIGCHIFRSCQMWSMNWVKLLSVTLATLHATWSGHHYKTFVMFFAIHLCWIILLLPHITVEFNSHHFAWSLNSWSQDNVIRAKFV